MINFDSSVNCILNIPQDKKLICPLSGINIITKFKSA